MRAFRICILFTIVLCSYAVAAQAGMIFVPNTYGLSARSVGLGNAMTAVGNDYSMAYYNPAALGDLDTSMLDINYMYAGPQFTGGEEDGDEETFDQANKLVLIGFTMNLATMFKNNHGLGLGFDLAIDNNLKSFMNFESERNPNGQFLRYGLSSVTMVNGIGVEIIPQLHIGVGGYILVAGENKLVADTDMAGNTSEEEIQVSAEPAIAPIFGIYSPINDMITIGAAYRGKGVAKFNSIDAQTRALVSESPLTTLNLIMNFKDAYVPQQVAVGIGVRPLESLLIAADVTWANWGDYEDEIAKKDDVRSEGDFKTRDIIIPRFGVEYTPWENYHFRAGYYWEDTPFEEPGIGNVVILDNARHVGSFGVAHDITYIPFMAYPTTIGATYFFNYLTPQSLESDDGRTFESSGYLNGVIGSLTLRF